MRVRGLIVTTWWSLLLRRPDRRSAARLVVFGPLGLVLILLSAFYPAAAAGEELRVIAVHTASAPRVSMVVQPPGLRDQALTSDDVSVTVGAKPVAATVTPLASSRLSVALVIDTASDLTAQELAAVQYGAIDFLLQLPEGAHTMVVA